MTSVMQKIDEVMQAAAKPCPETRVCKSVESGQTVFHQGDVYLHLVSKNWERGESWGSNQVAVGATVGSRHIVQGAKVQVFKGKKLPSYCKLPNWLRPETILGPVVVAETEFTLTHPEHAHHVLPAGTYQVTYQADYSTGRAVQD